MDYWLDCQNFYVNLIGILDGLAELFGHRFLLSAHLVLVGFESGNSVIAGSINLIRFYCLQGKIRDKLPQSH